MGNDAFYHGARILDAVREPDGFYEFDPKIHAPEGSLLTWPWGYDYAMAKVVRGVVATGIEQDPVQVMLWIPVAGVFVAVGLLIVIARQLGLSNWPTTLAALCMALLPTTQWLYGFGQIDHHGTEMIFILASLAAGIGWLRQPGTGLSLVLAAVFGVALAVHNGLFIIQLPFLIAVFVRWVQGISPPTASVVSFLAMLVGVALAMLVPSLPFREYRFEFYTLSWFHLYIVCCTSLFVALMSRFRFSRTTLAVFAVIGVALLIPIVNEIRIAGSFVSGSLGILNVIQEMQSPVARALRGEARAVTLTYSILIWLAPLAFLVCLFQLWRFRASANLLFWIGCVTGLALLAMQMRLHYFGSFALYVPWLVLAQEFVDKRPHLFKRTFLIATLALLLAYGLQIRHVLVSPMPRGGDTTFAQVFPLIPTLREACKADGGVVLADADAGHYIRYFTRCSVIANNFLLTQQHFDKVDQMLRLFASTPEQIEIEAPYVKYVLIRPARITPQKDDRFDYSFFVQGVPTLANHLLFNDPKDAPPDFKLLDQVSFEVQEKAGTKIVPYARLYKIERRTR